MAITDWPADDRPREKLLSKGAAALSDAELVAIFLRTGVTGKSAVDLAREVVAQFGSLSALCSADQKTFCAMHGLGVAKYVQLQAVLEMAQRALGEQLKAGVALTTPQAVRDYLRLRLQNRAREVFIAVFLDARHCVLAVEELFAGTLMQTSVYPREVVKAALKHNAAAVIFAHNHPSGLAQPSNADELLTATLKRALALVEVKVLDHFVVGADSVMSFNERGIL
ncbi:MAG: JAB domain-containing protein [Betaproteobacteria bacterium]|nr:JAB domain-containing protein [Betaproteobacteria bacterium]